MSLRRYPVTWTVRLAGGFFTLALLTTVVCERPKPPRLGYVDSAELLNKFERAVRVRAELQTTTGRWQAQVKLLEQELAGLRQRYIDESPAMSANQQKALRDQIVQREQDYTQVVQELNTKAARMEIEKMQPVYDEINTILREYGKRHGYDMILGATPAGNIVYADTASNLTDDILGAIARRQQSQRR